MSCCLSMSTVNPTPGVCQNACSCCGDGGASNASSIMNSVGKWGTTLAGVISGRPVAVGTKGVSVGASAAYASQVAGTPNMTVIIVVAVVAIVLVIFAMKR